MAYDVVSNATLWFCHHHLFDLPRRPRFDRQWAEAWDAYRGLNAAVRRGGGRRGRPRGAGAGAGLPPVAVRGDAGRRPAPTCARSTSATPPSPTPACCAALPRRRPASCWPGWPASAPAASTPRAGRRPSAPPSTTPSWPGRRRAGAPRTFVAPLGPDPAALAAEAASPAVAEAGRQLDEVVGDRRLVVRVDRVELSKNLLRGFWAFEELLETRPEWRGPGGAAGPGLPLARGAGRLPRLPHRGRAHGGPHQRALRPPRGGRRWCSTWPTTAARSVAALARYDVLLVNPVRDGMNLVAKEGPLVNAADGVLVLSREAGAYEELARPSSGSTPSTSPGRPRPSTGPCAWTTAERAERAARLRRLVAARTAAGLAGRRAGGGRTRRLRRSAAVGQAGQEVERRPRGRPPPGRRRRPPRAGSRRRPPPPGPRPPRSRPARPGPRRPGGRPGRRRSRRRRRGPAPWPAPPCPCRRRPAGAARAPSAPAGPPGPVAGRRPLAEGPGPALGLGVAPPVQGHRQPLGLHLGARAAPRPRPGGSPRPPPAASAAASGRVTTAPPAAAASMP